MAASAWDALSNEERHRIILDALANAPGCADSPEFLRVAVKATSDVPNVPSQIWYYTPITWWERVHRYWKKKLS
jgi:hypothetical protein